nr:hypothetical protein [Tanacetum cinerariifolium]
MILESVKNGPLIWPTIDENGVTRTRKYSKLTHAEAIQADCDVKKTNIILQGLPPKVYALDKVLLVQAVGNKMHKAFPLPGESSHWQYKFPLPVEGVPTARRMEIPLPGVCTAMMKKLPVKEKWHFFIIAVQTPGSGISILLAVGTPSTGSGNLYCQWELSPGSGNALEKAMKTMLCLWLIERIFCNEKLGLHVNNMLYWIFIC